MKFIKRSTRSKPRVSLVLLDWSVRESFHLLHYLSEQLAQRDSFEVIVVEFYDTVSDAIRRFEDQVDTWLVLEMPRNTLYHKHLMYNAGIAVAHGDIIMIGDSDAMVKPTFIQRIIDTFAADPGIVYHMDQFRNVRRDFHPFSFPSFEEVLGDGCINNAGGKTKGMTETEDLILKRNYGACMCAWRRDLIEIGGADMHVDYLGHVCGPYEMTFRLVNHGRREVWDQEEYLYHTWHPGQAGADNFMGPHDGSHNSTTALEARGSGRVRPLEESPAIELLRADPAASADAALAHLISPDFTTAWDQDHLVALGSHARWTGYRTILGCHDAWMLVAEVDRVFAVSMFSTDENIVGARWQGHNPDEVIALIDAEMGWVRRSVGRWARRLFIIANMPERIMRIVAGKLRRVGLPLPHWGVAALAVPAIPAITLASLVLFPLARPRLRAIYDFLSRERGWSVSVAMAVRNDSLGWKSLEGHRDLTILVGDPGFVVWLRLMVWVGLLPRGKVMMVEDGEAIRRRVAQGGLLMLPHGLRAKLAKDLPIVGDGYRLVLV